MGKTVKGGSTHEKNVKLLTHDQRKFLGNILKDSRRPAQKSYLDLLKKPQYPDEQFLLDSFQKGIADPLMQNYNQQILPSIQQRFVDANAGSSSALNQALAQSAKDLSTQMGQFYLPFLGSQQQFYQQQQQNRLSALAGLGGLAGQQTFQPIVSQQQGLLGPAIGAGGMLGAAKIMASSEKVKENIRDYNKGLDVLKDMDVKIYDYIESVGGAKNKVGVIAEKVPEEIQASLNGVKAVDLYGLVGLLINAVKELNEKIEQLEEKK